MQVIQHVEVRADGVAYLIGRTVKAKMVARMVIWDHVTIEEVAAHYALSVAQVHAAIAFYYDNQAELEAQYQQQIDLLEQIGTSIDDLKARRGGEDH